MAIILFIIVLAVLIFVHELGHFIVAKLSGIRVDEFSVGFPPRIWCKKRGETKYSIGVVPLGGFVTIHGENPDDDEEKIDLDKERSFINKPKYIQALVLIAGILFNILFAWVLISISFMSGYTMPVNYGDDSYQVVNQRIMVLDVNKDSPAERVGISTGDSILSLSYGDDSLEPKSVDELIEFISSNGGNEISLTYERDNKVDVVKIIPLVGAVGTDKAAIGISPELVGEVRLPFFEAIWKGFKTTGEVIVAVSVGFFDLIKDAITGGASLDNISGPVGIVSLVGNASQFGLVYLMGFTAFISINLAIINLLPLPALDGGRLVVVLIEAIIKRNIKPKIINAIHATGFMLLILLLVIVTFNDISRLF